MLKFPLRRHSRHQCIPKMSRNITNKLVILKCNICIIFYNCQISMCSVLFCFALIVNTHFDNSQCFKGHACLSDNKSCFVHNSIGTAISISTDKSL